MSDIYYINRVRCYRDRDNYMATDSEVAEEFGYFTDSAEADAKVEELNADIMAKFKTAVEKRKTTCKHLSLWASYQDATIYEAEVLQSAGERNQ